MKSRAASFDRSDTLALNLRIVSHPNMGTIRKLEYKVTLCISKYIDDLPCIQLLYRIFTHFE